MPMMNVGVMEMRMAQRQMLMGVHMRFLAVPAVIVRMLVMGVVAVRMRMVQRLMLVIVHMLFRQMQPYAGSHQRCG